MCRNLRQTQSGIGLPVAIFVVLVLGLVSVAISELDVSSREAVVFDVQSTRALMAAQSGADLGINRLFPPTGGAGDCTHAWFNSAPSISYSSTGLEDCEAVVSCADDTALGRDYYLLTSIGACGTGKYLAERTIEVRVMQ